MTRIAAGLYVLFAAVSLAACSADPQGASAQSAQALNLTGAVLTQHVDNGRTGWNPGETQLTVAGISQSSFGKLYTQPVDGRVFAHPLFAPQVSTGSGVRDLTIVATERNNVYAFDAHTGALIWQTNLGVPVAAGLMYPPPPNCQNIPDWVGITGTPVIDPATGTLYVVNLTSVLQRPSRKLIQVQFLNALDISTGLHMTNSPRSISAQVSGDGPAAVNGQISFDALKANQRAGLLFLNNKVYVAWAGHCDDARGYLLTGTSIFFGWLMSFDATTLARTAVFNTSPHANPARPWEPYGGSIWHGAGGIASDGNLLYVNTGNALFDPANGDWGDSTLAFNQSLARVDSFTPWNQFDLDAKDLDLSSGGIVIIPQSSFPHTNLLVTAGKEGTIYVLDRNSLGGTQTGLGDTVCQPFQFTFNCVVGEAVKAVGLIPEDPYFGVAAYFNQKLYFGGNGDVIKAFSVGGWPAISAAPVASTPAGTVFGYPGTTPSISSNGTNDGIVWALQREKRDPFQFPDPTHLHAYRADNLAEIYNSLSSSDDPDGAGQFMAPTIGGGKVFIGTSTSLAVYGLFLRVTPASQSLVQGNPASFTVTAATAPVATISLSASGLPPGASAQFFPSTVSNGGGSTLTISTSVATPPGTYTVTVTGTGWAVPHSTTIALTVTARDLPPVAAFISLCTGRSCSFDGSGSTDDHGIVSYAWLFGDGSSGSGARPVHAYASNGTYTVQLTVTDTVGQTGTITHTVSPFDALPAASFSFSCTGRSCSFDASASTDDLGIAAYGWSFGDGTPAGAGRTVQHHYASNGSFVVTLTVTDSGNQSAQSAQAVSVFDGPPHAGFSVVCIDKTCSADAETSGDDIGIVNYAWSWGDGTSSGGGSPFSAPSHTYLNYGTYLITLTVSDVEGQTSSASQTVTLGQPPAPAFTFSCTGRICSFDASASSSPNGAIASYHWQWDDETTSDLTTPATGHTFASDGTFAVTLTVTDVTGSTASVTHPVAVFDAPPVASFSVVCVGLACSAEAEASSDDLAITSYSWSWGDGSPPTTGGSSASAPTHTYTAAGSYAIVLTVFDQAGQSATDTHAVVVGGGPAAAFTFSCTGLTCTFNASVSGGTAPIAYSWDFGDESTLDAAVPTVQHTYTFGDTFGVHLTITDGNGATAGVTHPVVVTAPSSGLTAAFTISCSGLTCSFDASGSGGPAAIVSYHWDFGDETATDTTAPAAAHVFAWGDTFGVYLMVTDANGTMAGVTHQIRVP